MAASPHEFQIVDAPAVEPVAPESSTAPLTPFVAGEAKALQDALDSIGSNPLIECLQPRHREKVASVSQLIHANSNFWHRGELWCDWTYPRFQAAMGNVSREDVALGLRAGIDCSVLEREPRLRPDGRSYRNRFLYRVSREKILGGFVPADRQQAFGPDKRRPAPPDRLRQLEIEFGQCREELRREVADVKSTGKVNSARIDELEAWRRSIEPELGRSVGTVGSVGRSDRSPTINHPPSPAQISNPIDTINHNHGVRLSDQSDSPTSRDRSAGSVFLLTHEIMRQPSRLEEWFEWLLAEGKNGDADRGDFERVLSLAFRWLRQQRKAPPSGEPGGLQAFASNVQNRRWHFATDDDRRLARDAMKRLAEQ